VTLATNHLAQWGAGTRQGAALQLVEGWQLGGVTAHRGSFTAAVLPLLPPGSRGGRSPVYRCGIKLPSEFVEARASDLKLPCSSPDVEGRPRGAGPGITFLDPPRLTLAVLAQGFEFIPLVRRGSRYRASIRSRQALGVGLGAERCGSEEGKSIARASVRPLQLPVASLRISGFMPRPIWRHETYSKQWKLPHAFRRARLAGTRTRRSCQMVRRIKRGEEKGETETGFIPHNARRQHGSAKKPSGGRRARWGGAAPRASMAWWGRFFYRQSARVAEGRPGKSAFRRFLAGGIPGNGLTRRH